jgi:ParB family chromosome partitioning protein
MPESSNKRQVLGRGFSSLISSDFDKELVLASGERIENLKLEQIEVNPNQPRKHFDEKTIIELAASIKQYGIIQPLVVSPIKGGKYIIIAGERRFRAASIIPLEKVPVIVRDSKELEQLEIALIENVQRVDLNPLEQAASIDRLHQQFSLSYDAIAKRLGKASSTVTNIARLLQLSDEAKEALRDGKITEGHARTILSLKGDEVRQKYLLNAIINNGWNVRQAERFVISVKEGVNDNKEAKARTQTETPETIRLSKRLGTDVNIKRMAYGGRLEIKFESDDDLTRIINFFG